MARRRTSESRNDSYPWQAGDEERSQTMNSRISPNLYAHSDPVSLGELCEAMFIEGARVLGYAGEALMPTGALEQVFLATVMIADGLGLLLQSQYESDGS